MFPFAQMKALCKRVTFLYKNQKNFEYPFNLMEIKVVLSNKKINSSLNDQT